MADHDPSPARRDAITAAGLGLASRRPASTRTRRTHWHVSRGFRTPPDSAAT
jgi:hypothetical protein